MKAVKGNKVYLVDEANKKDYQDRGFDILDEDGKVIAYGRGKTVPYGDYEALKKENEALKAAMKPEESAESDESEDSAKSEKKTGKK